ncbi:hypothetical protein EDB86DRAFT_1405823 [Lactarius hatsudake]|nr:hypothetical protein EDB86DRAFT_1405823 [Lactarius hatsudake]
MTKRRSTGTMAMVTIKCFASSVRLVLLVATKTSSNSSFHVLLAAHTLPMRRSANRSGIRRVELSLRLISRVRFSRASLEFFGTYNCVTAIGHRINSSMVAV